MKTKIYTSHIQQKSTVKMNLDEKQTGFYLAYLKYKKEKQIKFPLPL